MNRLLIALATAVLYLLHQDLWFWRDARPLVFGFLPVGLAYHAVYCLAVTGLMWALVQVAWPAHLESAASDRTQPAVAKAPARSRRSTKRGGGAR
jgi:hypothetical protein